MGTIVVGTTMNAEKTERRALILKAVRERGPLTKDRIARLTAINPRLVSAALMSLWIGGVIEGDLPPGACETLYRATR